MHHHHSKKRLNSQKTVSKVEAAKELPKSEPIMRRELENNFEFVFAILSAQLELEAVVMAGPVVIGVTAAMAEPAAKVSA
jgi:hypothetical protein